MLYYHLKSSCVNSRQSRNSTSFEFKKKKRKRKTNDQYCLNFYSRQIDNLRVQILVPFFVCLIQLVIRYCYTLISSTSVSEIKLYL